MTGSAAAATILFARAYTSRRRCLSNMYVREHMLTLNLWKKEGNDQESLCKDFTKIANEKNLAKAHIQNFKRKKIFPL